MVNSAEKSGLGKTTQWRLRNRPLFKIDLVFSFHLCATRERKETFHHIFKLNFYVFLITGKMAEIKSLIKKLEIDFYRTRKWKPPLNNAEEKPKNNISPEVLQKYIQWEHSWRYWYVFKVLQIEFTMESVPKLGIIQVFGDTINKYGYLDQSIHVSSLKIDYLTRIDAICSLFMNYS